MRLVVVGGMVALMLTGIVSLEAPAIPGLDNCTAAMIAHSVAVYEYNQCVETGMESCVGKQLAVNYARNQVLFWCFPTQV